MGVERLAASLVRLQDALAAVRLPLDVPGAEPNRARIRSQIGQIDDYVLPRLRRLDAPLLAVVGGSTGAGKSTLVNSLIGRVVTSSGVIRPTTRSSVLVHHPDDARWFTSGQVFPGLGRSDSSVTDPQVLQLVPEPSLPEGLAILDAPDVDSVVSQNRTLAAQLLAAADLWLFVTSAARYADAVPWQYLRAAAKRQAVVAVVLDRVPPAAIAEVPSHLGQMMSQRGLAASPLFAVPETAVDDRGLLPDAAIAPIRAWLADLAEDTVRRNQVVLQTLDGAIGALAEVAPQVVQAVADQNEAVDTLRSDAEKSFAEAARSVATQTADGSLLRGEVLARWQDFVGTGDLFRAVEKKIGLFRDRMVAVAKGEPKKAQDVQLAVESGLEVLIREEGEFAARRVVSAWEAHPAGRQLLARDGALGRLSLDFGESAARVIRQWQGDVLELVATAGGSKKAMARYLALGVNGAGVALMIFVFSQTGGLVGAEIGVAGGTAMLAQRVLEAVFGEDAVRRLAKEAKQQLDARVEGLMAAELLRFETLINGIDLRPEQGQELVDALAELQAARIAPDRYEHDVADAALAAGAQQAELPGARPLFALESGPVGDGAAVVMSILGAEPRQRGDDGEDGLLPSLVMAQLSALDQAPQLAADVAVEQVLLEGAEPGSTTGSFDDPTSSTEVETSGAEVSTVSSDPVGQAEARPIPVPAGLPALVAEAVRRPAASAADRSVDVVGRVEEGTGDIEDADRPQSAGDAAPATAPVGAPLTPPDDVPPTPPVPGWPDAADEAAGGEE